MKVGGIIRVGIPLVVVIGIVALAVGIWRASRRENSGTIVFPDGSRLTVLAALRGGEKFTTERPWQKQARRWLPQKWVRWLPDAFTSSGSGDTNSLIVWFNIVDATGANTSSLPWQWFAAVGDDGFCYPMSGGSGSSSSGKTVVHQIWLRAFPRRQAEFDLRFLDANALTLGTIRLRNPVRGPFPDWTPERLPITRTNGPIVVMLESLTERSNSFSPYSTWIAPKWKLVSADTGWQTAKPGYLEYEDATGNSGGHLSFAERAWKLTLPFRKTGSASYSDEEKFLLPDLAVPEPGTLQLLQTNFQRLGVTFTIQAVAGPGRLAITNGTDFCMLIPPSGQGDGMSSYSDNTNEVAMFTSRSSFFLIETSQPDPLDDIRFRLVGSDQKEIPMKSDGRYGKAGGGWRCQQKFDVTNEVSSISLEVIVSRARPVEFVIDPAEVRRIGATNR